MNPENHLPKRVAILQPVITEYRLEFFRKLMSRAKAEGIQIDIFTGNPPQQHKSRGDVGKEDFSLKLRSKSYHLLGRTLRKRSIGPVIQGSYNLVILEQSLQNLDSFELLFRLGGKRIAFWGHGATYSKIIPKWQQQFKYYLTRKGIWFFGYTYGGVKAVVNHGFAPERCTVLNNSIDTSALRNQITNLNDIALSEFCSSHDLRGRTALYIGGLDSYKRIPLLLQLAEEAHRLDPDFRMLIAGDGSERNQIEKACAQNDWLTYLGRLIGEEKALALRAAQAIAIPGAIGLIALDALVSGKPIVTISSSLHGPEFEYLEVGRSVLLANEKDYPSTLVTLLRDDEKLASMSRFCVEESRKYSLDAMIEQFLAGIHAAISLQSAPITP